MTFVPALTGLGSPHWDPEARGLVTGLTRGTTRAHLVRAALEAIAFQIADVLDAYPGASTCSAPTAAPRRNAFLMQFQADILGVPVDVAADVESDGLGAAALAGLACGTWPDVDALPRSRPSRSALRAVHAARRGRAPTRQWHDALRLLLDA